MNWITLLNPAYFWWFPLAVMAVTCTMFFVQFRGDEARSLARTGHGHIVAWSLLFYVAIAACGWIVYLASAVFWLIVH